MHLQIVKSGKDTFLGNPQASGEYSKVETVICLQNISKHIADERCHFIIVSALKCLIQRDIIFIN